MAGLFLFDEGGSFGGGFSRGMTSWNFLNYEARAWFLIILSKETSEWLGWRLLVETSGVS